MFSSASLKFSAVFLTLIVVNFRLSLACQSLKNVFMEVEDTTGARFNKTLTGCIQNTIFDGKAVTEIHVRDQNVPRLGKDYVKHLVKLDTLEFTNCKMESIDKGAFRNLPKIRVIEITHNYLTEITGGIFDLFDTIKILKLNNNKISSITDGALSNMTITEVNFSHNNLTEFKNVWFANSPIEKLDFSYNQIKSVTARVFVGMPALKEVNFERNQISNIELEAFTGLTSLEVLNLKSNQLGFINKDVFPNKITIDSLNLAANFLIDLPIDVLEKVSLKEIVIDHNPWLCPCLTNLKKYFKTNNVSIKEADNCKVDFVPVCIDVAICEIPRRNNRGMTMYHYLLDNLDKTDRECIGLIFKVHFITEFLEELLMFVVGTVEAQVENSSISGGVTKRVRLEFNDNYSPSHVASQFSSILDGESSSWHTSVISSSSRCANLDTSSSRNPGTDFPYDGVWMKTGHALC